MHLVEIQLQDSKKELYYLSELPSRIEITTVLGIAVIAIALAFLATIYPAWKAANTEPVDVLRNE